MAISMPELPGNALLNGIKTGGNLFTQMMGPKLKREAMAQAWQQHLDTMRMQKAAAGRAAQAASDAHELFLMKKDPLTLIKQMEAMQNYMNRGKGGQQQASQEQSFMPGIDGMFGQPPTKEPDYSALAQMFGGAQQEPEQGQYPALQQMIMQGGMQPPQEEEIPQLNEQAISPMSAAAQKPQDGIEMFKTNPMLRAWFRKNMGYDPAAQTPEEKLQEKIKLHAANRQFDIDHPTVSARETALTGAARDAESMKKLEEKYPPINGVDSDVVKQAKLLRDSKITNAKDLSEIRSRALNGLKPGDMPIKDPETGEEIGYSKQLTKDQAMQEENRVKFDMLYPLIVEGASMLSGPGATLKLEQAAREYNTNPKARKIIDKFLIAEKALTNATVTESARFGSGKQNQIFNRYRESLQASDIPQKLKKWIKEYEIPAEANLKAGREWLKILDEVDDKSKKMVPARRNYYFDPEKQYAADEARHKSENSGEESPKTVIVIDPTGKRFETSEANAAYLPKGWKLG